MSKFIIINDGYCHEDLTIWFIFLDRCQNHNNELNLKLKKRNLDIENYAGIWVVALSANCRVFSLKVDFTNFL